MEELDLRHMRRVRGEEATAWPSVPLKDSHTSVSSMCSSYCVEPCGTLTTAPLLHVLASRAWSPAALNAFPKLAHLSKWQILDFNPLIYILKLFLNPCHAL